MFKTKYRVIHGEVESYEAQVKFWWLPFWFTFSNRCNMERARKDIQLAKNPIIWKDE